MINRVTRDRIDSLAKQYAQLLRDKPEAVRLVALAEIPEMVYNSNAIENSTLTLQDTEDILLRNRIKRDHDVREIYEAKNLAKITEMLLDNPEKTITPESILELHKILLSGIHDNWAGRFRSGREWVRVGGHVGANPDFVEQLVKELLVDYKKQDDLYFLEKIAWFHAESESIHPVNDGNGRLGRVLINQQLQALGLPPIIIQNRSKRTSYYPAFDVYRETAAADEFTKLFAGLLIESLYKRITLLSAPKAIPLTDWAEKNKVQLTIALNKAARGTLPAFRLRENWVIAADYKPEASISSQKS